MFYSRAATAGRETRELKGVGELWARVCGSGTDADEASREEFDMDSAGGGGPYEGSAQTFEYSVKIVLPRIFPRVAFSSLCSQTGSKLPLGGVLCWPVIHEADSPGGFTRGFYIGGSLH